MAAKGEALRLCRCGNPINVQELREQSRDKAEALARDLGGPVEVAEAPPLAEAALLVNTTSLGMQGHPPLGAQLLQPLADRLGALPVPVFRHRVPACRRVRTLRPGSSLQSEIFFPDCIPS